MASKKSKDKCIACNVAVGKTEAAVACETCGRWNHVKCTNMDEGVYESLKAVDNLHWFCNDCNGFVVKFLGDVAQLQKRQDEMDEKLRTIEERLGTEISSINGILGTMKSDLKKVASEVTAVTLQIGDLVPDKQVEDESLKKQVDDLTKAFISDGAWNEVVKKNVEQEMTAGLKKVREDMEENLEIERRKGNLIFHGVTESNAESDIDALERIFANGLHLDFSRHVVTAVRIGRQVVPDRPRPLKVQIKSADGKKEILVRARSLKETMSFKRIFITPDLTRKQQSADKELRMKLKQFREQGETGAKIKYGKIVKNVDGQGEVVLYRLVQN